MLSREPGDLNTQTSTDPPVGADVDGTTQDLVGWHGRLLSRWKCMWPSPWNGRRQLPDEAGRDQVLPGDMKDLMNRVTEAKAAEANLIARREETAAMRSQANTVQLLWGLG